MESPSQLQRGPAQMASRQSCAPMRSAVVRNSSFPVSVEVIWEFILVHRSRIQISRIHREAVRAEHGIQLFETIVFAVERAHAVIGKSFGKQAAAIHSEALTVTRILR